MCQSGRMGRTRNAVCPKGHQRFESSHLRINFLNKNMSHEIEANFVADWSNPDNECSRCTSFDSATGFCSEAKTEVPPNAHCDFFQSRD